MSVFRRPQRGSVSPDMGWGRPQKFHGRKFLLRPGRTPASSVWGIADVPVDTTIWPGLWSGAAILSFLHSGEEFSRLLSVMPHGTLPTELVEKQPATLSSASTLDMAQRLHFAISLLREAP